MRWTVQPAWKESQIGLCSFHLRARRQSERRVVNV